MEIVVRLQMSLAEFLETKQFSFASILANITSSRIQEVMVTAVVLDTARRSSSIGLIQVNSKIGAENATVAMAMTSKVDESTLNSKLSEAGLPSVSQLSLSTVLGDNSPSVSTALVIGVSCAAFVSLVTVVGFLVCLYGKIREHLANKPSLNP